MIKVLCLRESPVNKNEGVDKHCHALFDLFYNDDEIKILPITNILDIWHIKFLKGKQIVKMSSLIRMIKASNCDVVHVHGFASFFAVQAIICSWICRKKIMYTAHYHPIDTLDNPKFGRLFFRFLLCPILRFVDGFIALNNEDKKFFSPYIKCIFQIPHWARIIPHKISKSEKNPKMILFVGRNKLNKGIDHLLSLPKNEFEVHCVCGTTNFPRKDFILHHNVSNEELADLYAKASLLVVPSKYEAFSLVSLEAFMFNTPVLMSDRVRIADYLNGCAGFKVFKYGDFDDFYKSIYKTMSLEVDTEAIKDIFDPIRIKELYKNAYKTIFKS